MCGSETLATEESSTCMNVAMLTVGERTMQPIKATEGTRLMHKSAIAPKPKTRQQVSAAELCLLLSWRWLSHREWRAEAP